MLKNIKIINENSKIKKVCLDILHLKDENISNNFIEKINNLYEKQERIYRERKKNE